MAVFDFLTEAAHGVFELAAEHPEEALAVLATGATTVYAYGYKQGKAEGKAEAYQKEATTQA